MYSLRPGLSKSFSSAHCNMKKSLLLVLCLLVIVPFVNAQHAGFKGSIIDTLNNFKLTNASVAILRSADSILISVARADVDGRFQISTLSPGKFIVLVSFPAYAQFSDKFELKDNAILNLGDIILVPKMRMLQEVIIKQQVAAMRMKGDTLEFKADSFYVPPNATVEDLLKQLTGIQVDRKGKITVQGQTVQKILVDGEEFFGDDPTLVTQNLRADMVDKVQVYDRKSDQAIFTGIDDGKKMKTINLTLKEDKKKGFFGKINTGAGNNGYHDSKLTFNKFSGKEKIALYGIVSNTGTTGLDWQEQQDYGSNLAGVLDGLDSDPLDTWNGTYDGQGYPLVQTGGLHYNNKWNQDKTSLNGNYKVQQLYLSTDAQTKTQYLLDEGSYYTNQHRSSNNSILRNKINGIYEFKIDAVSSIKATVNGSLTDKKIKSLYQTQTLLESDSLLNDESRSIQSNNQSAAQNLDVLYRRKLQKKGRTLSVSLTEQYNKGKANGFLSSVNNYYQASLPAETVITNQHKTSTYESLMFRSKIDYTEPIAKSGILLFTYSFAIQHDLSDKTSYNKGPDDKFTITDSLFSSDFRFDILSHRGGLNYTYTTKKLRVSVGNDIGLSYFKQKDYFSDSVLKRDFTNWFPSAVFTYIPNTTMSLGVSYTGATMQPNIQQLQPIYSNTDPLNVAIGNPELKPSFQNSISASFINLNPLQGSNLWMEVSYNLTQNAITSNDVVDENGKRTYQAVNVNGNRSLNGLINYNFTFKPLQTQLSIGANFNSSRYVNIINRVKNVTNSDAYGGSLSIRKSKSGVYDISIAIFPTYTSSQSSIQKNNKTRYWVYRLRPDADIYFPFKLQLHSDYSYFFRQKTTVFNNNNNVSIWNAWIGKRFFQNNTLLVKISANDILNQNRGFSRSVSTNYISEQSYATIQRYFMLSVQWDFSKWPKGSKK